MMSVGNSSAVPAVDVNLSSDGISHDKHYIFTPAGLEVKLTISLLIATTGVIGFLGNLTVLHFIRQEKKKRPRAAMPSNLHYFVSSLALSDVLGAIICVPILMITWFIDVLMTGWPCRISRFFIFLFATITIYNIVVISLERYILTCRATSRPLSRATVQKLVKCAWILAFFVVIPASLTVKGLRIDINETHYTVICKHDSSSPLNAVIVQASAVLVYIVPVAFVSLTCVSVIRAVWTKKFHAATTVDNHEAVRKWRSKQKKATVFLLAIILAFVMPYVLIIGYTIFGLIAKLPTDFKRDFVVRSVGVFLTYLNSSVNFGIHLVQLPGFRLTLYRSRRPRGLQHNVVEQINEHEMPMNQRCPANNRTSKTCEHRKINAASMTELYRIKTNIPDMAHGRRHSA